MVMAVFETVTGVDNPFAPNPKVYPNPFMDELRIIEAMGSTLRVMDAKGATVHIQEIVSPDEIIRFEHLPANVYFFRIEKDGMKHTIKVIKTNQ